jgi:hypothetical protein
MEFFRFGVEKPLTLGTTESDELFNKPRQEMSKLASANDKLMVFRFFLTLLLFRSLISDFGVTLTMTTM